MLDQVRTMEDNLLKLKKGDVRVPVHRWVVAGWERIEENIVTAIPSFQIGTAEDQVHGELLPEDQTTENPEEYFLLRHST